MSILSVYPKYQPFEGSETLSSGALTREYQIIYFVTTDDETDNALTVLEAHELPEIGDTYSYGGASDPTAKLTRRDPRQVGPKRFEVTCTWTSTGTSENEEGENPLAARPKRSWRTMQEEINCMVDLDGKAVRNSAGHPRDGGIAIVRHYSVYVIERNEAYFPTELAATFVGAVNSSGWNGRAAGTVKMVDLSAEEQYWEPKKLWYVTVHYELAVKPEGWDTPVVDEGPFYYKVDPVTQAYRKYFTETDPNTQTEVTRTFLLDGNGEKLSDERAKAGNVYWLQFRTHPRANFGILRL